MAQLNAAFAMMLLMAHSEPEPPLPTTGAIIAHHKTRWLEPHEPFPDRLHYVVMVDRESRVDGLPGYVLVEYNVCYRDTNAPPNRDYRRVMERVEPPASKTTLTRLRMRLVRNRNCDCPLPDASSTPDHCGNVFRFTDDVMPIATRHLPCYSLACDDFEVIAKE